MKKTFAVLTLAIFAFTLVAQIDTSTIVVTNNGKVFAITTTAVPAPPPIPKDIGITNVVWLTNIVGSGSSGLLTGVQDFLKAGSNFMVAPYAAISTKGHSALGGGIGIGYRVSEYVVPFFRADYIGHQFTVPSGTLQLQYPIRFSTNSSFALVPLVYSGVAVPIGSHSTSGGAVAGLAGGGLAVRVSKKLDGLIAYEKRSNLPGNQILFGFVYKF